MIITGASGLLGSNLAYYFKDKYSVLGLYHSHEICMEGVPFKRSNLLSRDETQEILQEYKPEVIIHCAALADIDLCEKKQEMAYQRNVVATGNIVESIKGASVKFIYISTDSVYGGTKDDCLETDAVHPPNYYGFTKYQGEQEALKKDKALIARINIFGWNSQNKVCLAEWILRELSHQREIQGFVDVFFSSIYTFDLAKLLGLALARDIHGIYNLGSRTSCSKYEFAVNLSKLFKLDQNLIKPVSVDRFPFAARRAKNLRLNTTKLSQDLHCQIPTMEETLNDFYRDSKSGLPEKIKACLVLN
jgi:dTDP-4-dehydrorhamnose reductase